MPSLTRQQLVILCLLTLVWGLNWPVMKTGVQHFPPLSFRALSMLIGLPLLALGLVVLKVPFRLERRYWGPLLVLGFFNMVMWHTLIIVAIPLLPSGRAAILGYTMPIFSAALGHCSSATGCQHAPGWAWPLPQAASCSCCGTRWTSWAASPPAWR